MLERTVRGLLGGEGMMRTMAGSPLGYTHGLRSRAVWRDVQILEHVCRRAMTGAKMNQPRAAPQQYFTWPRACTEHAHIDQQPKGGANQARDTQGRHRSSLPHGVTPTMALGPPARMKACTEPAGGLRPRAAW